MSDTQVQLTAVRRSDFGKGAARRLRRSGQVPAVIYGHGTDPIHVALDSHDLTQALKRPRVVLAVTLDGTEHVVAPRDVQRDVVRQVLEHVDLVEIDRAEAAQRAAVASAIAAAEAAAEEQAKAEAAAAREAEREAKASRARTPRHEKSFFEKLTENTMVRQMARSAAREITRSIFGTGRRR